jgi:hypothetical protein
MARRINSPTHDARTRLKIKTSQLINRLQLFALGAEGVDMSNAQVRAAVALIGKTVPDLRSVELKGDAENPVHTVNRIELVPVEPGAGQG